MAEASVNGRTFTKADTEHYLRERNNWGRWGDDDEMGTINLITPEKRVQAASLVRAGRSVSLSRPFPKEPGAGNPKPARAFSFPASLPTLTSESPAPTAVTIASIGGVLYATWRGSTIETALPSMKSTTTSMLSCR